MLAFRRTVLLRQVVVNLQDGSALKGLLYRQTGPLLVLKNAEHLAPGVDPLPIDGDAVVERDRVLFIQAL